MPGSPRALGLPDLALAVFEKRFWKQYRSSYGHSVSGQLSALCCAGMNTLKAPDPSLRAEDMNRRRYLEGVTTPPSSPALLLRHIHQSNPEVVLEQRRSPFNITQQHGHRSHSHPPTPAAWRRSLLDQLLLLSASRKRFQLLSGCLPHARPLFLKQGAPAQATAAPDCTFSALEERQLERQRCSTSTFFHWYH